VLIAVDTAQISRWIADLSPGATASLRAGLRIPPSAPVGIYCGALEKSKNIPFLVASAKLVRKRVPDFHLVLVGGGPESVYVADETLLNRDCIRWTGPTFCAEKAALLNMADVFLLPGKVGLAILDAFAARLPLFTTRIPNHCPEVEYLEDGRNGIIAENSVEAYAQAVTETLCDPARLAALKNGAYQSSLKYSIEAMVANFCRGIRECLNLN
jgi:glycosyltransferase involved in cell wall biosynthesis